MVSLLHQILVLLENGATLWYSLQGPIGRHVRDGRGEREGERGRDERGRGERGEGWEGKGERGRDERGKDERGGVRGGGVRGEAEDTPSCWKLLLDVRLQWGESCDAHVFKRVLDLLHCTAH